MPFLRTYGTSGADNITDTAEWNIGKWVAETFGHPLTLAAMNHADGTITGDWTLNAIENDLAKIQTEAIARETSTKKDFDQWLKDELYNNFYGKSTGLYAWSGSKTDFHYPKPSDGYTAFGDARIKVSGTVNVCKSLFIFTNISILSGVVELEDRFSFSAYSGLGLSSRYTPTAVGFRLEDSGFIHPFNTKGTWRTTKSFTFY